MKRIELFNTNDVGGVIVHLLQYLKGHQNVIDAVIDVIGEGQALINETGGEYELDTLTLKSGEVTLSMYHGCTKWCTKEVYPCPVNELKEFTCTVQR